MQDLIEEGVERFWWHVTNDTPPEARSEADARRIWPRQTEGKVLEADSELAAALRQLANVKAQMRALEKQEQALKNELLPTLADYEAVMANGQSLCSYKANKDSQRTDWHLLAEEEFLPTLDPDTRARLLAEYTATLPGARVLRLAKSLEAA